MYCDGDNYGVDYGVDYGDYGDDYGDEESPDCDDCDWNDLECWDECSYY